MESELINIDELKNLYGEETVKELLDMSVSEGKGLIESLKSSVPARQADAVVADAHQLKGMSATMTMSRVAELAQKLERSAKAQNWDESETLLKDIEALFLQVEEFLRKVQA